MLSVIPPGEAARLLRSRLERLDAEAAALRGQLERHGTEVPRLFLVEAEYDLAIRDAETAWVRSLLDELDTGAFPDLELWHHFHETGEIPPRIAELAGRKIDNPGRGPATP